MRESISPVFAVPLYRLLAFAERAAKFDRDLQPELREIKDELLKLNLGADERASVGEAPTPDRAPGGVTEVEIAELKRLIAAAHVALPIQSPYLDGSNHPGLWSADGERWLGEFGGSDVCLLVRATLNLAPRLLADLLAARLGNQARGEGRRS